MKKRKKLQLHRETLRTLGDELSQAAGAATEFFTDCTCPTGNECNPGSRDCTNTRQRSECGSCDTCYCTQFGC